MKFYIHIVLILLGLGQITFAQHHRKGALQGKILYKNGDAVDMATVLVKGTSLYAMTNEKGFFKIEHLPVGKQYEIEVKTFGNESVKTKIHFERSHQEVIIKLNNDEGISLSEVTVLGSGKGKQTKEQGYAMNLISTKEAVLQNIQTTELLGRSAGIKIRQSAGLGSDISFNLNGLSGNSVRIFIDGIPIRNYGRSFSLSSIPPSMIERIEVYKGVLPAELSEDALGGGINVVLKKDMQNNITASYSYGSFNTHQWDLNASYRDKKSGFTATLSSYHNYTDNNYKVWGEFVTLTDPKTGRMQEITATRFHDKYYATAIKGSAGFTRKKWADEFLLGFMFSKMEKDIQTGATMRTVYGNRRTNSNSNLASLRYKKNNLFTKGLDVSTFFTVSTTYRDLIDNDPRIYNWLGEVEKDYYGNDVTNPRGGEGGNATYAENKEKNLSNRSNIHYHITKNHTLGVSYFFDQFSRDTDDRELPNEVRNTMNQRNYTKNVTTFNYEGHFLNKKLKTTIFYKLYQQRIKVTDFQYEQQPNTGYYIIPITTERKVDNNGYGITLSYAITPQIMLLASAEKALRLPSATELLGNNSEQINASYSLLPETGNNFNVGFNLGMFHWRKHDLSTEINFFIRDIKDLITRGVPSGRQDYFSFENLGKILSKGVDWELRYAFDKKLFVNANASYNDARFNLEFDPATGLRYSYYKKRLRNQPYFTSNINVEYVFDNLLQRNVRLAVNYNFNYTHEFFRDWEGLGVANKVTIPSQPLHDIGLTYTFPNKKWVIGFNAKNIFDTQVFDNYALQKPGRAFFGKITYSIF